MSKINDGGPAFPFLSDDAPGQFPPSRGMTLRDWLAGQMLAGMGSEIIRMASEEGVQPERMIAGAEGTAAIAYCFADAMLSWRAKGGAS